MGSAARSASGRAVTAGQVSGALALSLLIVGCGQKGALYLPAKGSVVTRPAGNNSTATPQKPGMPGQNSSTPPPTSGTDAGPQSTPSSAPSQIGPSDEAPRTPPNNTKPSKDDTPPRKDDATDSQPPKQL